MDQKNMEELLKARKKIVTLRAKTEQKNILKKFEKSVLTSESFNAKSKELDIWKNSEI